MCREAVPNQHAGPANPAFLFSGENVRPAGSWPPSPSTH
jgi:hypothetical protein